MTKLVVVSARWGEDHGEDGLALRLFAGALATRASVEIVSLGTTGRSHQTGPDALGRTKRDSAFVVHDLPGSLAERERAGLIRAALARTPGDRLPAIAGGRLTQLGGGRNASAVELIDQLEPDAIVLAGSETAWLPPKLRATGVDARLISLPMTGDDAGAELADLEPLFAGVEAVGTFSEGERRRAEHRLATLGASAPAPVIARLDVALAVNRSAASSVLLGMSKFGRHVVVLTGFPPGSPGAAHAPGPDYGRRALGSVAIAEVGHDRWLLSDSEKAITVPVKPSRVNLWRLFHQADAVLDLRPQGLIGRECIEALLLGTPVVVPEGTVAAEHAELSNGGLWYRDYEELFAAGRALVDDAVLRTRLGEQGREWAERVHGDQARFVDEVAALVLGEPAG